MVRRPERVKDVRGEAGMNYVVAFYSGKVNEEAGHRYVNLTSSCCGGKGGRPYAKMIQWAL